VVYSPCLKSPFIKDAFTLGLDDGLRVEFFSKIEKFSFQNSWIDSQIFSESITESIN